MSLTINGTSLTSVGAVLKGKSGLRVFASRRGSNIDIPLLHGAVFRPMKRYEQGVLPLSFWIMPFNPATKTITLGSSEAHLEKNLSDLLRLVHTDTVLFQNTRRDSSVRQALCEIAGEGTPKLVGRQPMWYEVDLSFTVVGAFWEATTMTAVPTFALGNGGTRTLTELSDCEAPMDNMIVTFIGPANNPRISQAYTGVYVQYNGTIAAGQRLNINTQTGSIADTSGGSAWAPNDGALVHSGETRLFSVRPEPTGPPVVTIGHTGAGTISTALSIRKKYMTG